MSHKMLRPFIVKVSVLGYFPLYDTIVLKLILNKFIYKNKLTKKNKLKKTEQPSNSRFPPDGSVNLLSNEHIVYDCLYLFQSYMWLTIFSIFINNFMF